MAVMPPFLSRFLAFRCHAAFLCRFRRGRGDFLFRERLSVDPFGFGGFATAFFSVWVVVLLLFFLATLAVVKKPVLSTMKRPVAIN